MPCARQASQDVSQQTRRAAAPNTICFIQSTHQAPASHVNSAQALRCGVQHNISGGQGSTTLQTQPRHSSMNLCSYRCHKTNILPSHSSKAQTLSSLLCSHLYLRMEESWRDQMVQQPLKSQRTQLPLLVCTKPPLAQAAPCFLAAVCPACSPSPRANLP